MSLQCYFVAFSCSSNVPVPCFLNLRFVEKRRRSADNWVRKRHKCNCCLGAVLFAPTFLTVWYGSHRYWKYISFTAHPQFDGGPSHREVIDNQKKKKKIAQMRFLATLSRVLPILPSDFDLIQPLGSIDSMLFKIIPSFNSIFSHFLPSCYSHSAKRCGHCAGNWRLPAFLCFPYS